MATSSRAAVPLRLLFVILAAGYATIGLLAGRTVGTSVATGLFFSSLVTVWYVLRRWWRTSHSRTEQNL